MRVPESAPIELAQEAPHLFFGKWDEMVFQPLRETGHFGLIIRFENRD